jgi:hypothetical protein
MIPDPNPRGGTRGGRGILVDGDHVFVASYHTIHVFDSDLRPVRQISHPLFADIHDLAWEGEHIWVSSTALDCAVKIDQQGETVDIWRPREEEEIASRFGLTPLPIDETKDNRLSYLGCAHKDPGHTHLNTVSIVNGRPTALLNKYGCIVGMRPTRILVCDPELCGAHNLVFTPDEEILTCNTHGQEIRIYDRDGRFRRRIGLRQFPEVRRLRRKFAVRSARLWLAERSPSYRLSWWLADGEMRASRPIFVRGLCPTDRQSVLVGISPASVLEVDWRHGRLLGFHQFSDNLHEAVQDVECGVDQPSRQRPVLVGGADPASADKFNGSER